MKKQTIIALVLLVAVCVLLFFLLNGFPGKIKASDLENTSKIVISEYSSTEQKYTDFEITDEAVIADVCRTIASLKLKLEPKLTPKTKKKPSLPPAYSLSFYHPSSEQPYASLSVGFDQRIGYHVYGNKAKKYVLREQFDFRGYLACVCVGTNGD